MHRLISPELFGRGVMAFFTGKDPGADLRAISKIVNISHGSIYLPIQKHTDKVLYLDTSMEPRIADAVVTDRKDVLIGVQTADCVPVLLHDPKQGVIGAVHAGWRGTAAGIVKGTIRFMVERFACRPEHILLAIGPSIRGCSYEVDHEVYDAVSRATGEGAYHEKKGGKYHLDLAAANRLQALSAGVPAANVWTSPDCTFCNPERFYSYRYAKGSTGRQGGFIGML